MFQERETYSEGDTDEEVTSFLEKVDGTYWKTAYTNTDGKEFAKYFKLNDRFQIHMLKFYWLI